MEVEELIKLTTLCISQTAFCFQGRFYKMSSGLAMGSPLAPFLADLCMDRVEKVFLQQFDFLIYKRYVDDSFALVHESMDLTLLLDTLNCLDRDIQFTLDSESSEGVISFLDVSIQRSTGDFSTSVYHKPFAVCLPPHASSGHPEAQKRSAFLFFIDRAFKFCSTPKSLNSELNFIRSVAINRGFSLDWLEGIVRKVRMSRQKRVDPEPRTTTNICLPFVPGISHQVSNILRRFKFSVTFQPVNKLRFSVLKDPIPNTCHWGIYQIKCRCGSFYIGQTKRSLGIRVKEHMKYVRDHATYSAIAQHSWEKGHIFKFEEAKIIKFVPHFSQLDFYESFLILKNSVNVINKLSAKPYFSPIWYSLFKLTA